MHTTPNTIAVSTVAIDLAKDVFELAFADADAHIVERRRLGRAAFATVLDNRTPLRVVMETCGSAHYWARRFARAGHRVEEPGVRSSFVAFTNSNWGRACRTRT